MREIEFRGKYDDKWVYGYFIKALDIENRPIKNCIIENMSSVPIGGGCVKQDYYEIELSTLGQYTGIKDKNDTKIYDGDIIYYKEENMHGLINFRYGGWYITWYGYVQVSNGIGWEHVYTECNEESLYSNCLTEEDKIPYEIVGNVHDNPKLLEVAE